MQAAEAELGKGAELAAARAKWERLGSEWRQQSAAASFASHTDPVMDLLHLIVTTADRSRLTFDPAPDGYYLKTLLVVNLLPLEEAIAQARGMSTLQQQFDVTASNREWGTDRRRIYIDREEARRDVFD